jgi:hypothetical protein
MALLVCLALEAGAGKRLARDCNKDRVDPDLQIEGCTEFTRHMKDLKQLADAHCNLAGAYRRKSIAIGLV